LTIATAALATATLTVAFLASPRMSGTDANSLAVTIAKPKLVANGIEMTLAAANGREFKAGDQPAFELRAANTLNQPAEAAICVTLDASAPADTTSRMVRRTDVLWQEQLKLALGPNKTKVFALSVRTNLPANRLMMVILSPVGQAGKATAAAEAGPASAAQVRPILAMVFSTVPSVAAPAQARAAAGSVAMTPAPR